MRIVLTFHQTDKAVFGNSSIDPASAEMDSTHGY